jgi:hypothetical protein
MALGYVGPRSGFNFRFDKHIPQASGHYLIITCIGDELVLSQEYHDSHMPVSFDELQTLMEVQPRGVMRRKLADGTRVILVYGKDRQALQSEITKLSIDPERGDPNPSPAQPISQGDAFPHRGAATVYVTGESPVVEWILDRCEGLGFRDCVSFNTDYDKFIPEAKGKRLIIACLGGRLFLPEKYYATHLPIPLAELLARMTKEPHGTLRKTLEDGTRVVLVYGKDLNAIAAEIATLTLDAEKPKPGGR